MIDNRDILTANTVRFPELSFSCQNVLSLNVSTRNSKTDLKILAVTKKNIDVILLSDTRLNLDKQTAALHDLTKNSCIKDTILFTIRKAQAEALPF